ncbi:hypothetical protein CAMGR0001_0315 [Campylobacter gracilis RM3268]|uniref:Uncharacterized protein n=1 Tax=Campylobacter gracilis RM3268 TaxID=553220 RepID=C8PKU2_9BACT|nr:hypothetical protein CAMGR0001_0315 [Campylobacter gracilis RM3268]
MQRASKFSYAKFLKFFISMEFCSAVKTHKEFCAGFANSNESSFLLGHASFKAC